MKNRIFIIALVIALVSPAIGLSAQTTIKLAVTPASSKPIRDYLVRSYAAIGCTVEQVEVPAERARLLFNEGTVDALAFERDQVIDGLSGALKLGIGTGPWFSHRTVAYIRAEDSTRFRSLADLKGASIGFVRGLRLDSFVAQIGGKPMETNTVDSVVKMLLAKRFDVAIAAENALDEPIRQNNATKSLVMLPEPVNAFNYYHVLSAKQTALRTPLLNELKRTQAEFKALLAAP